MEYIMKIYNSQYFLIGIFVLIIILAIIFLFLLLSGGKKQKKKDKIKEENAQANQINNNLNNDIQNATAASVQNVEANITDANAMDNIVITPDMNQTPTVENNVSEQTPMDVQGDIFNNSPEGMDVNPVESPVQADINVAPVVPEPTQVSQPEVSFPQVETPVVPEPTPVQPVAQSEVNFPKVEEPVTPVIPNVNPVNNVQPENKEPVVTEPQVKLPSIDDLLNQANAATNNTETKQPDQFSSVYVNNNQNNVDLPKLNDENK